MTYEEIVREIHFLTLDQRKQLIRVLADSLTEPERTYDLLEFEGVGAHLADGTDAQEYVNQLRSEWDRWR